MSTIKAKATHKPGTMNGLEKQYADRLKLLQCAGEIHSWHYEPANWRLGDNLYYRPDFMVIMADGTIEIHETKGFWRDDARVKIKAFADRYPFVVKAVQLVKKEWVFEEF